MIAPTATRPVRIAASCRLMLAKLLLIVPLTSAVFVAPTADSVKPGIPPVESVIAAWLAPAGWTTGVTPYRPSFWLVAVPIWVPVVVPNVQLTPSAIVPETLKRLPVVGHAGDGRHARRPPSPA